MNNKKRTILTLVYAASVIVLFAYKGTNTIKETIVETQTTITFTIPKSGPLQGMEPIENIVPIGIGYPILLNWNPIEEPIKESLAPVVLPRQTLPDIQKQEVINAPSIQIPFIPVYPSTPNIPVYRPPCQANASGCN